MMTHGNVLATVSAVMTIVPGLGSKDVYLAYLPLAHILELAAEVLPICETAKKSLRCQGGNTSFSLIKRRHFD